MWRSREPLLALVAELTPALRHPSVTVNGPRDPATRYGGDVLADAGRRPKVALEQLGHDPGTLARRAAPSNAVHGLERLAAATWPPEVLELVELARERLGVKV